MNIEQLINRIDWDKLRTFYYITKIGNFSKAGQVLHVSQPSLSRTIQALEDRLGCLLFFRSVRGLILTEQGELLFDTTKGLFEDIQSVLLRINKSFLEPQGPICIRATGGITNFYLFTYIPEFLKQYPKVNLTILANDYLPELDFAEADVAIRPPLENRDDVIQIPLFENQLKLYASPTYLEEFGTPETPEDLDKHRLIGFSDRKGSEEFQNLNWHLTLGTEPGHIRTPFISVNTPHGRLKLAELGMGIAVISAKHPRLEKYDLVEVLSHIPPPTVRTHYIYPKQYQESKRIVVLGEYLASVFKRDDCVMGF